MIIRNYQNNRIITKRKKVDNRKKLDQEIIEKINSNLEKLMEANNVIKREPADWQKNIMAMEEH